MINSNITQNDHAISETYINSFLLNEQPGMMVTARETNIFMLNPQMEEINIFKEIKGKDLKDILFDSYNKPIEISEYKGSKAYVKINNSNKEIDVTVETKNGLVVEINGRKEKTDM